MESQIEPVVIEHGGLRHLVGMARSFTMQTRSEIPALWQAFFAAGHEIGNAVDTGMFGVSFSHDGQGGFRYGVGVEVDPVPEARPEGTCVMTLSEGDYAVRRVFGPMADLPGQMDWLFCDWLPGSGYELREGAVFERYPHDARSTPEVMVYELWLPVQKAA